MATVKQWAETEGKLPNNVPALRWSMSCCILELRARVEALEHRFDPQRLATLEWSKEVHMAKRWSDQHLRQIRALEADGPAVSCDREPASVTAQPTPASSLVERVAIAADCYPHENARAAIREVAEWLWVESKGHFGSGLYWSQQLEKEAER